MAGKEARNSWAERRAINSRVKKHNLILYGLHALNKQKSFTVSGVVVVAVRAFNRNKIFQFFLILGKILYIVYLDLSEEWKPDDKERFC